MKNQGKCLESSEKIISPKLQKPRIHMYNIFQIQASYWLAEAQKVSSCYLKPRFEQKGRKNSECTNNEHLTS